MKMEKMNGMFWFHKEKYIVTKLKIKLSMIGMGTSSYKFNTLVTFV
jgi:hypothetical protein